VDCFVPFVIALLYRTFSRMLRCEVYARVFIEELCSRVLVRRVSVL